MKRNAPELRNFLIFKGVKKFLIKSMKLALFSIFQNYMHANHLPNACQSLPNTCQMFVNSCQILSKCIPNDCQNFAKNLPNSSILAILEQNSFSFLLCSRNTLPRMRITYISDLQI